METKCAAYGCESSRIVGRELCGEHYSFWRILDISCSVESCNNPSEKDKIYCVSHQKSYVRFGHPTCRIEECHQKIKCRGLCYKHYKQYNRQPGKQEHIANVLRKRIYSALKNNARRGSAVRDLGCSILQFRSYIENQFEEGMNWDNYGKLHGRWQLDHIRPLSSFDLTNRDQFLQAVHYTNYQPMWAEDNLAKSNRF